MWAAVLFINPGEVLLIFESFFNEELTYRCFLVGCSDTGQVAIVNMGFGKMPFEALIVREGWVVTHVLDTHLTSHYLRGGYLLSAEIGATYVSPFIKKESDLKACYRVAVDGMVFYIGSVKVEVEVKNIEATFTFISANFSKGIPSRIISKNGEGVPSRILSKSKKRYCLSEDDNKSVKDEKVVATPVSQYRQEIKYLNLNFSIPSTNILQPLSPKMFYEYYLRDRQIIDLRNSKDFEQKFIPGSLFIGQSYITTWAPYLVSTNKKLILIGEDSLTMHKSIAAFEALAIFDIEGYLNSTLEAWDHLDYPLVSMKALEFKEFFAQDFDLLIDVRTENEVAYQKIEGATNVPLSTFYQHQKLIEGKKCGFFCSGGIRSLMAASLAISFKAKSCTHLKGGVLSFQTIIRH
ncbi:hypothetical protein COB21_01895 [Candidatus Aerophobetes bacterium]|uniref:Rhodanese domain-containing protein n=1 Tax=Aerophobetes bacterium TaxID=2030807 RepID=A0A2A4X6D3_UNCAE|nr:MAG: hypothetical protein COB21_01895 [Candidatus Aerophobetes bacterium]